LEEVKDILTEYYDLQDAFDGLTKGSAEWAKKLAENNNLVADLLKQYPELARYVEYINGIATLPAWAEQYIIGTTTIKSM
jgi:hypothetical protein